MEGTWRAHQVPIADFKDSEHLKLLEDWMKSYRPHELFDKQGKFRDELAALVQRARRRYARGEELVLDPAGRMTSAAPRSSVLALNSGSSSLKFGLYRAASSIPQMILSGEAESIGERQGKFWAKEGNGKLLISEPTNFRMQQDALARIMSFLEGRNDARPAAVGHRVVHGGSNLRCHCLIDDSLLRQIEAATAFAPLHNPPALSTIRFAQEHFPQLSQVACFDTAFHAGMPDVARTLPIPRALRSDGIQRYGFHGLSCESIMRQLGDRRPGRLIIAHLGNGASVTAVKDGKSIDTSMGLTPTGGLIMGTRCGDLDPGVLVYLVREKGFDAPRLETLVDHDSGLIGISGVDGDMRHLHEAAATNAAARLAIQMFSYSVRKHVAAMIAALDGVDLLVFAGGIGEHDAKVRAEICDGLSWCGVSLHPGRNQSSEDCISDATSHCRVRVLPSEEGAQIAAHTAALALAKPIR